MKEKDAPVELVVEVLRRLGKAGVLQDMILVGSWCVHFYKEYFDGAVLSAIRTRDMDFLIRTPKNGNIWEWTQDPHGGPHWDVQHPDGSHTNVFPDGHVVGKDNF